MTLNRFWIVSRQCTIEACSKFQMNLKAKLFFVFETISKIQIIPKTFFRRTEVEIQSARAAAGNAGYFQSQLARVMRIIKECR